MKKEKLKSEYSSEEVDVSRYHNFMILLYPEWDNYNEILVDIRSSFKYTAFITHKADTDEKKDHTHLVLHIDDARTIQSISKRVGVPVNLLKNVNSLRGSLRYLTHIDFPEKQQYSISDVTVSRAWESSFLKAYDDIETDEDVLNNIYLFIDSHKELDPFKLEMELSKYVNSSGYITMFRRFYNTIINYISYISKH